MSGVAAFGMSRSRRLSWLQGHAFEPLHEPSNCLLAKVLPGPDAVANSGIHEVAKNDGNLHLASIGHFRLARVSLVLSKKAGGFRLGIVLTLRYRRPIRVP